MVVSDSAMNALHYLLAVMLGLFSTLAQAWNSAGSHMTPQKRSVTSASSSLHDTPRSPSFPLILRVETETMISGFCENYFRGLEVADLHVR